MAPLTGNFPSNPFDHAFEMLGHVPEVTTDVVNAEALESLTQALTTRAGDRGRMILLRSPRAGFGKSHLLMRLHQRVAHTHEFIPLEPSRGRFLDAQAVLDAVLRRFSRVLPAGGGLTVLDLLARRILATGLEPLVRSGDVPSQDRDSALQALQQRPVETFDFHNEDAVTARWAMANFSLLGPRLTAELAERTHAGYRPVAWWVELLFRYSSAAVEQTSRNSSLFETVFGGDGVETDMHEKLVALLKLTGLVTSPVLVLDEVEGFSSNPDAAIQVTTFLNALHQSCNKLALIISVNGDVWETAFLPRLPCGLKDRLCDIVVDLKPMDKEVAASLLYDRAGDRAEAILEGMDFDTGVTYARGLIREASESWQNILDTEMASASEQYDALEGLQKPISLLTPEVMAGETPGEASDETQDEVVYDKSAGEVKELHAPAAVVMPGVEPPSFSEGGFSEKTLMGEEFAAVEPGGDAAGSVFSIQSEQPVEEVEPSIQPQLPDDLPQPFIPQQTSPDRPALQEEQAQSQPFIPSAGLPAQEEAPPSPFIMVSESSPEVGERVSEAGERVSEAGERVSEFEPDTEWSPVEASLNVVNSPFSIDTGAAMADSPFMAVEPEAPVNQPSDVPPPSSVDSPFRMEGVTAPTHEVPTHEAPTHEVTDDDHEKVEDLLKQFRDRYGRN